MSVPFSWFTALRYLQTDKAQSALVLSAVSIGVSVIVFLSALINGLQASLIEKTLGSQPHVTLRRPREAPRVLAEASAKLAIARTIQARSQRLRSIDQWPSVLQTAQRTPGVSAASPVVSGAGFALRSDAKEPILVRGVELESSLAILDIRKRTGNLDSESSNEVFELLRHFNRERATTFLVVTHDPRIAGRCDRVLEIIDGQLTRQKPSSAGTG